IVRGQVGHVRVERRNLSLDAGVEDLGSIARRRLDQRALLYLRIKNVRSTRFRNNVWRPRNAKRASKRQPGISIRRRGIPMVAYAIRAAKHIVETDCNNAISTQRRTAIEHWCRGQQARIARE